MKNPVAVCAVVFAVIGISGCGGQSQAQKTSHVDNCVSTLLTLAHFKAGHDCNDPAAMKSFKRLYHVTTTCAHQSGNQYLCQATIDDQQRAAVGLSHRQTVRLKVTDDGKTIFTSPVS